MAHAQLPAAVPAAPAEAAGSTSILPPGASPESDLQRQRLERAADASDSAVPDPAAREPDLPPPGAPREPALPTFLSGVGQDPRLDPENVAEPGPRPAAAAAPAPAGRRRSGAICKCGGSIMRAWGASMQCKCGAVINLADLKDEEQPEQEKAETEEEEKKKAEEDEKKEKKKAEEKAKAKERRKKKRALPGLPDRPHLPAGVLDFAERIRCTDAEYDAHLTKLGIGPISAPEVPAARETTRNPFRYLPIEVTARIFRDLDWRTVLGLTHVDAYLHSVCGPQPSRDDPLGPPALLWARFCCNTFPDVFAMCRESLTHSKSEWTRSFFSEEDGTDGSDASASSVAEKSAPTLLAAPAAPSAEAAAAVPGNYAAPAAPAAPAAATGENTGQPADGAAKVKRPNWAGKGQHKAEQDHAHDWYAAFAVHYAHPKEIEKDNERIQKIHDQRVAEAKLLHRHPPVYRDPIDFTVTLTEFKLAEKLDGTDELGFGMTIAPNGTVSVFKRAIDDGPNPAEAKGLVIGCQITAIAGVPTPNNQAVKNFLTEKKRQQLQQQLQQQAEVGSVLESICSAVESQEQGALAEVRATNANDAAGGHAPHTAHGNASSSAPEAGGSSAAAAALPVQGATRAPLKLEFAIRSASRLAESGERVPLASGPLSLPEPARRTARTPNPHRRMVCDFHSHAPRKCKRVFSQLWRLHAHVAEHATTENKRCTICDKEYSSVSALNKHKRELHLPRPFGCRYCKSALSSEGALRKHEARHERNKQEKKRMPCADPNCAKTFLSKSNMAEHYEQFHRNKPPKRPAAKQTKRPLAPGEKPERAIHKMRKDGWSAHELQVLMKVATGQHSALSHRASSEADWKTVARVLQEEAPRLSTGASGAAQPEPRKPEACRKSFKRRCAPIEGVQAAPMGPAAPRVKRRADAAAAPVPESASGDAGLEAAAAGSWVVRGRSTTFAGRPVAATLARRLGRQGGTKAASWVDDEASAMNDEPAPSPESRGKPRKRRRAGQ